MHRVKKELDKYKRMQTEREFEMRRNKLVVKLETDLEWFKKEALDLRKRNERLTEQLASLTDRCRTLHGEKQVFSSASSSYKVENN